ncbi:MAG TPA: hypothetical protein VM285_10395, partial [Polyangia bacterium]|nr:hypothetical protein [Polyangia bacterium]
MKQSRLLLIAAFIVTLVALGSKPAAAADGEGVTVETFKPSTSVTSIFELTLPEPKEHLEWYFGGLVHYAHHPVRRELAYPDGSTEVSYPV